MSLDELRGLRKEVDAVNLQILNLLSRRGSLVKKIREAKIRCGLQFFDPQREEEMVNYLTEANRGPYSDEVIRTVFKEIFRASLHLQEAEEEARLLVRKSAKHHKTIIRLHGTCIGGPHPVVIAGPCAIESRRQLAEIAAEIRRWGIRILRGGAFKPRTSPYSFQGLGREALEYMSEVADDHGLVSVVEVLDVAHLDLVCSYVDVLQVGARNMHNSALLKAVGSIDRPVLLKRGFMATIEELLYAAEYIMLEGNADIILCERGIRTFEGWTRNTLDISAVAILKQMTHLPVVVDISHSAGRKDIVIPLAKAAWGVGADGIMVEVHNDPNASLSDAHQQLDFGEFELLLKAIDFCTERSTLPIADCQ